MTSILTVPVPHPVPVIKRVPFDRVQVVKQPVPFPDPFPVNNPGMYAIKDLANFQESHYNGYSLYFWKLLTLY